MAETTTIPAAITVLSGETLPVAIDFTAVIAAGQVPTTPTALLYDVTLSSPGTPVSLGPAPSLSGNVVTQSLTGLVAGKTYRLILGLTAVAGVVWQAGLTVVCPF